MKRKFGRHLTMAQKKFLDLFTAGLIRQARNAPWGHNLNFNIDDYPQLQNHLNDIHCYENMPVDAERYVNDKISKMTSENDPDERPKWVIPGGKFGKQPWEDIDKFATDEEKEFLKESEKQGGKEDWMKKIKCTKCGKKFWVGKIKFGNNPRKCPKCKSEITEEDIDKFANGEEKEFLKESLADQRSMAYIDSVGGDLDKWEQFVQKMNPRDRKEAAFELKSAISGINHYIEHWTIPGGHRREKQEKRELYRKFLKRLEKVAGVGSGGEFKVEPEDYNEDIDKFATAEEKEFLKENWQGRLQKQYDNFEEFERYDEFYGLAEKLGYDSAKEAWEANPVVSGSVNPEDYHKVREDKDDWRKSWAKNQIEKLNQKRIKLQHSSITKEKEAEIKQIYSDMAELKNMIKESTQSTVFDVKRKARKYLEVLTGKTDWKLTAKTVGFSDLMRGEKLFIRIHDWNPKEFGQYVKELQNLARKDGFIFDFGGDVFSEQLKESKNEKGKTRPVEYPYEIYTGFGPLADWEWRVLKHYQSPEKERENPYARVFCSVSSPMTQGDADMGDVYCKDIPGYKYDDKPDFSKTIDTQRLKNLSNKEMDMLADMFKIKK